MTTKEINQSISDVVGFDGDFHSCLNAMHKAEEMLLELSDDVSPWDLFESYLGPVPVHATAAQRAEAFLRTIGKWTE